MKVSATTLTTHRRKINDFKKNMENSSIYYVCGVNIIKHSDSKCRTSVGGDSFENATQIYSGYSAEAIYPVDSEDYFYILVNPGQRLVVKGSNVNEEYCEIDISINDKDKMALKNVNLVGRYESSDILWTPNSEEVSYKYYIKSKNKYGGYQLPHFVLNVSIEDHYDAESEIDAGDTFDTAMRIFQGNYEGFISGNYYVGYSHADWGTDSKDFYKLSLSSGDKINVKLTPSEDVKLNLKIYNQDRVVVNSSQSPDVGVISRASWTVPSAQNVYVMIERAGNYPSRAYNMDISVEPFGPAITVETDKIKYSPGLTSTLTSTQMDSLGFTIIDIQKSSETSPEINIESIDKQELSDPTVFLSGSASSDSGIKSVTVNGQYAGTENWIAPIDVSGDGNIVIIATGNDGNTTIQNISHPSSESGFIAIIAAIIGAIGTIVATIITINEKKETKKRKVKQVVKLSVFILLVTGTLGLLINEFIFEWGTTVTLIFAALNILGLAILTYMYWGMKKEV